MKMKCLIFSTVLALLSVGCSDKDDTSQDLVKKQNEGIVDEKNKQKNLDISIPKMERPVSETKKELKKLEEQRHNKIQAKFNKHAECVKSQNVDIIKDSARFKAVFDSCWRERMMEL